MRSVGFRSVEITKCDRERKAVFAMCGGCRLWRLQTERAVEREVCRVCGHSRWGLEMGDCGVWGLQSLGVVVIGVVEYGVAVIGGCRV